jgi:hypothetical protein
VVLMSGPYPHSAADLALAPVLLNLEQKLARLRDSQDLAYSLALELNDDNAFYDTAAERARRVEAAATRNVDLHGLARSCDARYVRARSRAWRL